MNHPILLTTDSWYLRDDRQEVQAGAEYACWWSYGSFEYPRCVISGPHTRMLVSAENLVLRIRTKGKP